MTFHARDPLGKIRGGQPDAEPPAEDDPAPEPDVAEQLPVAPRVAQSKFGSSLPSAPFPSVPAAPVTPAAPALSAAPAHAAPAPVAPAPAPPVAPNLSLPVEPAPALTPAPSRRPNLREIVRRITPTMAILTIGSVGSALFLLRAMTTHTTPVAVLLSAGVVTALVFALDTVILTAATYRETRTGESGRALGLALLGGISAVICALAMAGTLILVLVLNG